MERRSDGAEVHSVNAHLVECLGIHDVEAAAPIHQYFGERFVSTIRSTTSGYLPGCGTLSEWSVRSKVMADFDHRRKGGMAGWVV